MSTQSYTLHTNGDGNRWVTAGTSTNSTTATSATSMQFTGLIANTLYAFTVVANNAAGTGPSSTTVFQGLTPVVVIAYSAALTTGQDGSIWIANSVSNTVQQITNVGGTSTARPPITVGSGPARLLTALDGSTWVSCVGSFAGRQISMIGGVPTAQPALAVGARPEGITTGADGSIWITNPQANTVQQIDVASLPPPNLAAASGPGANQMTLAWTTPPDGGPPILSCTVRAYQGTTYFTVTASNFAGTSQAAGLLIGPDGKMQSFSEWGSPSGYTGETIIQKQSSRVNQVGNVRSQMNDVSGYAYQTPAGTTLKSITLTTDTNNLGIRGIAMM